MLAYRFLDLPGAFEICLNDKRIARAHVDRHAAVRGDGDFALHDVDEFVGCIGGVVAARRGFPGARNHATVV